jgi:hypothetical protein
MVAIILLLSFVEQVEQNWSKKASGHKKEKVKDL